MILYKKHLTMILTLSVNEVDELFKSFTILI